MKHHRTHDERRVFRFVAAGFGAGLFLVAAAELWQPQAGWLELLRHLTRETGFAFLVASSIAVIFELFLSSERDRRIRHMMGHYEKIQQEGFRDIFVDRQNVFDSLLERVLPGASHVRIIGICISIFREFRRQNKRPSAPSPIEYFTNQVLAGQRIEALMLKRDAQEGDLAAYGLKTGDFYRMREWDEDKPESFNGGKRLRKIANEAVGQWIEILVNVAERCSDRSHADRRETVHRLSLREYIAMPSVSLYIVDEEIFVTPYLYRRHCSSVPAFSVGGRQTRLYRDYLAHFTEVWNSKLTTPVVPQRFLEALIEEPHRTAHQYRARLAAIREENAARVAGDPNYVMDVEYFRAEERAMLAVSVALSAHDQQAPPSGSPGPVA